MAERCAYHSTSKRHTMPKASDTTPSEETTHIIHHHGLHISTGLPLDSTRPSLTRPNASSSAKSGQITTDS